MIQAHWKYLQYVLRHKWYVFLACLKYGLIWQGITHDWSKFLPSEWNAYVQYFYGNHEGNVKEQWKGKFDEAWNHHQKRQPHHWQYWVLMNDSGSVVALPMPDKFRKEMIADWRGAGKAITGKDDTPNWYIKNRDKMNLHPDTRKWVESQLGVKAEVVSGT